MKGKFFVIDGTDGTGKATQLALLKERLEKEGFQVVTADFPQYGKNILADTVAAYLRNEFGNAVELNPYLASLPFAGDRWKASPFISSSLNEGKIVISNRYTSANMGHQGSKFDNPEERKKYLQWLHDLEFSEKGYGIPKPDATLILYLNPEIGQRLVDKKNQATRDYTQGIKRDGLESDLNHLKKAAQTFKDIAAMDSSFSVVDCENEMKNDILPQNIIHEIIWQKVKTLINENSNNIKL